MTDFAVTYTSNVYLLHIHGSTIAFTPEDFLELLSLIEIVAHGIMDEAFSPGYLDQQAELAALRQRPTSTDILADLGLEPKPTKPFPRRF